MLNGIYILICGYMVDASGLSEANADGRHQRRVKEERKKRRWQVESS